MDLFQKIALVASHVLGFWMPLILVLVHNATASGQCNHNATHANLSHA